MNNLPAAFGGAPVFEDNVPISNCTLPDFESLEPDYKEIFRSGMVTNSQFVRKYEEQMARYLGVDHAVALSSATSGLLLMLKCLELEGEVILPSFTFSVTGHALSWAGLKPIFVDIDPMTCLIDPDQVESAISPRTAAILGVHVWGNPCLADQLQEIADRHGVHLLFDAAQATGSRYLERPVGGYGSCEVFSCSPTKLVTSGEGGILSTNDKSLADKVRVGRNYGDDGSYDCEFEGINARMSEFHAVLGLSTLAMADANIQKRQALINIYKSRLGALPGIDFQKTTPGGVTNGVYFSIIIDEEKFGISRDNLYESLKLECIDTRRYYFPPLHRQKVNTHLRPLYEGKLPHTDYISDNSLTLPMFSHMTADQAEGVCYAIERLHEYRSLAK